MAVQALSGPRPLAQPHSVAPPTSFSSSYLSLSFFFTISFTLVLITSLGYSRSVSPVSSSTTPFLTELNARDPTLCPLALFHGPGSDDPAAALYSTKQLDP